MTLVLGIVIVMLIAYVLIVWEDNTNNGGQ
jgi:hypothetical protein